jgi:hypothetical protein
MLLTEEVVDSETQKENMTTSTTTGIIICDDYFE